MQRTFFVQLMTLVATILLILMFFFPDYTYVKHLVLNKIETINLILLIGLYVKDLLKSA